MSHHSSNTPISPIKRFARAATTPMGAIWLGIGVTAIALLVLVTTSTWQGMAVSLLGTSGSTVLGLTAFTVTVVVGSAVAIAAVWLMIVRNGQNFRPKGRS